MKKFLVSIIGLASGLMPLSAQPVITSQPTNQIVQNGSNAVFNVAVSGTGPFTYQWQANGTNIPNIITTVAGSNSSGYSGDGGAAITARLNGPNGVALDTTGSLYIADTGNDRIRRVNANGIINTVAGNSGNGPWGDGGAATNASLFLPMHVAIDASGNYFIADKENNRIRKVDTNGIITTVAGKNSQTYSGDGGAATNAGLSLPESVAVDAYGNLFIADYNDNRVRKVDTNGIITTVAGKNSQTYSGDGGAATNAGLYWPNDVAVDGSGELYIVDSSHYRIRQVDINGTITTVAGNGSSSFSGDNDTATNAGMYPSGVAVDGYGNLFISGNYRIRKVALNNAPGLILKGVTADSNGNYDVIITSSSGSVTSSVVTLSVVFPPSVVAQPQNEMVTNGSPASFNVSVSGTPPIFFQWQKNGVNLTDGGDLSGSATNALSFGTTTTNDPGYYVVILTNACGCVTSSIVRLNVVVPPGISLQPTNQKVVSGSNAIFNVAVSGTGPFTYQWQLNGTNLPDNTFITTVAGNGTNGYLGEGGTATSAEISSPSGVAVDASGNLFIADCGNNRVRKVDTNGIITTVAGTGSYISSGDGGAATNAGFSYISSVAVDLSNNLFIVDEGMGRIRKVDTNGIITTVAGKGMGYSGDGGAATNASMSFIQGVAVDASGNLFIADWGNSRTRKVNANGIISTLASVASYGVAVDAADNVFIANDGNLVYKADTNGTITTVAGNGVYGFSGDGGAATSASLYSPDGVAVDIWGNLFIADCSNSRIRKVNPNGMIATVVGKGGNSYYGDGGTATNAGLNNPKGVAVDAAGNLYIADQGDHRIRKVNLAGSPTLTLNNVTPNKALVSYSPPTNSVYLPLNGASATNMDNFSIVVTCPYGSVTSSIASLTVLLPPSITTQPANVSVTNGGSASFNVAVSGTAPLGCQWFTSSGSSAVAVPNVAGGSVYFASIINGGWGYSTVPQVKFVGGSGSGASGTAVVNNGMVTKITITSVGYGYFTPPVIQIDNPSPTINTLLTGRTDAGLTLPAVTSSDTTNYFVVVTNNYGSVTSAMASLTVFLPPQEFSVQNVMTGLQMSLTGSPSFPYILQSATNLTPPVSWKSIRTNYADISGNWQFTDTNVNGDQKFYRAVGP